MNILEKRPLRVLHFVTGGFSGATQVAIDLCDSGDSQETLLVLRRRANDPSERITQLRTRGLRVELVPRRPHLLTIWRLRQICLAWKPDILVAHGFSDHLWGRYAGLLARVPHLVHVEHNVRERYGWWRRQQSLWLARRTDALVAVSDAVREALVRLGHPPERCVTIHNGIDLSRWARGLPWEKRENAVVMAARFSRQKDHATLIRAAHLLAIRGNPIPVYLAGGGSRRWRKKAQALIAELGVQRWVHLLGPADDLPALYGRVRYCVLSTHYEGLPLALLEGMASGCCAIGSDVEGVREVIENGVTGRLVPPLDPQALANALTHLAADPEEGKRLAESGLRMVKERFNKCVMQKRYRQLLRCLVEGRQFSPDVGQAGWSP
jgi:glycosyltransferase involved in cell wall biosynthesis